MSSPNTSDQYSALISEYLGSQAAIGGPFAILDLRHDQLRKDDILSACQARLMQINQHAHARTPEADEVRLAVHTAGHQLLDPSLREELMKLWPQGSGSILQMSRTPAAWLSGNETLIDPKLVTQARWLIGASGGWNAKSRKRLGIFARTNRVPASRLIRDLVGGINTSSTTRLADRHTPGSNPAVLSSTQTLVPWTYFPLLYMIMGALLIGTKIYQDSSNQIQSRELDLQIQSSPLPSENARPQQQYGASESSNRLHYTAILHELSQINDDLIQDELQARRFNTLGQRLCDEWTSFSANELTEATRLVRSSLAGVLNEDLFLLSSSFLATPGKTGQGSLFQNALRRELSENQGTLMFGQIKKTHESSIGDAVEFALHTEAEKSTDDPAWWKWMESQIDSIAVREWDLGTDVWLKACRSRLIDGTPDESWTASTRIFVKKLRWGDDVSAKIWYMTQINDQRVRSDRLAVLSQAVALYSSVGGIDTQTVLAKTATMNDREAYLSDLRSRWVGVAQDSVRDSLILQLRTSIDIAGGSLGEAQVLNAGMELARLNTACWVRERGDDSAVGLLDQKGFIAAVEQGLDRIDGFDFSSNQQDEQWSEMVQNTDDPGELMDLLRELDRRDRIQPKSSHALVLLAMQAPDLDVRDFAERVLVAHREDMNVLIALDRVAGLDRVSRRMNGVIGLVLGVDGNLDQHDLRRAIFRKLLELRILQDSGSARMYSIFANQYHRLLGIRVSGNGQATAQDLYVSESQQLMQAGNIVPMDVRAAIQIGLIRATNQAQNDAVYLDAALKVFAAHIADQNAGMLTQVSSILRDHRSRLEDSESVYEQIMLSERAFASLWLLLLESESFS